jgi:Flp pilus assembly pilin Flp
MVSSSAKTHEVTIMVTLYLKAQQLRRDVRGQDMIEYALLAASISMAAGAFLPQWVGPSISAVFSKVTSCLFNANG